jgi:hypothetical protein
MIKALARDRGGKKGIVECAAGDLRIDSVDWGRPTVAGKLREAALWFDGVTELRSQILSSAMRR